ncbi:MAG: arginase family protein [Microcella sp.]
MMRRFTVVPQWQGSGAARAMRLQQGAEAIAADLPARATDIVEVPLEAGDAEGTRIHRYSSIRLTRERTERALADLEDGEIAIVIGGDCGVEFAGVERAARRGRVVLLWADAHADLNTPETSPSGAYHGMVLRDMIDRGLVAAADVVMLGVRALDDAEAEAAETLGIETVRPDAVESAIAQRSGDDAVLYVHVDLDVLDPAIMASVGFAEPFGLSLDELLSAVRTARAALPLGGAGVTEYAPAADADPELLADEAATILRVIASLSSD